MSSHFDLTSCHSFSAVRRDMLMNQVLVYVQGRPLWLGMSRLEVELKRGIMFFWENLKKKKEVLICEWSVGSLFSMWRVPGCPLDKPVFCEWISWKGALSRPHFSVYVCACIWLRAQAHVCRERTPLTELRVKETEECLLATAAGVSVMLFLLSVIVLCVCVHSCTRVCVCMCETSNWSRLSGLSPSANKNEGDSDVDERLPNLIPLQKAYRFIMGHIKLIERITPIHLWTHQIIH